VAPSDPAAAHLSGVREGSRLRGLPAADGHVFGPVRPREAAGVSQRPAAVPSQLDGSPARPPHSEGRRRLL